MTTKDKQRKDYNTDLSQIPYLNDSYSGGTKLLLSEYTALIGNYAQSYRYINQYPLESIDRYHVRLSRAANIPLMRGMVEQFVNPIFSKTIRKEQFKTKQIERFFNNATQKNETMKELMYQIATLSTFQNIAVMVDNYSPETIAEIIGSQNIKTIPVDVKESNRLYPYVNIILFDKIVDFYVDNGRLQWIKLDISECENDDPYSGEEEVEVKRLLITPKFFQIGYVNDDKVEWQEPITNTIGVMPIRFFYPSDTKELELWQDVAKLQQMVTNWVSLIDENFYFACYPFLAKQIARGEDIEDTKEALNSVSDGRNIVGYHEGTNAPQWIDVDVSKTTIIINTVKDIINLMRKIVGLDTEDEASIFQKSGISIELTKQDFNQALAIKAKRLDDMANWILSIVALYEGVQITENDRIDLPDTFDMKSTDDKITIFKDVVATMISKEASKEAKKELISLYFPDLQSRKPEIYNSILKDIDMVKSAEFTGEYQEK